MTPLAEAIGLSRHYAVAGGRVLRALDGVDVAIEPGETLGLVGESGSGKSTLGRTLVGLQTPTRGTIRFAGADTREADGEALRALRRRRQFVFQDPSAALNPRMTLGTTLSEHLSVQGFSRTQTRARVPEVLVQAGLSPDYARRYPHEMSGGQRQRAVIARAISTDPDFLVADEPVSALDVSTRAQIINLLRGLAAGARPVDAVHLARSECGGAYLPPGRRDVSRPHRRDGAARGLVHFTPAPLHARAAVGGAIARPAARAHAAANHAPR